jgi:hypothetical protein
MARRGHTTTPLYFFTNVQLGSKIVQAGSNPPTPPSNRSLVLPCVACASGKHYAATDSGTMLHCAVATFRALHMKSFKLSCVLEANLCIILPVYFNSLQFAHSI